MSDEIKENLTDNLEIPVDEIVDGTPIEATEKPASPLKLLLVALGIFAFAALVVLGYFYLEEKKKQDLAKTEAEPKEEVVVSVKVVEAEKTHISQELTTVGTVAPAEQSIVSASISAQIKQMRLLKNQVVRKGEVLAVLASQDLQAQRTEAVAALDESRLNLQTLQSVTIPQTSVQTAKDLADAKANADNARALYVRRKDLYNKGGLSLKELEASQLALTNAENALKLIQQNSRLNTAALNPNARAIAESKIRQAEARLKNIDTQTALAQVVAPISGIVTDQFQFDGEFASQGAKLLTIAEIGNVIVKAQYADAVAANLHNGDGVTIYPNGQPDEQMSGKISLNSRSADPTNRTVEIWATFGNPRGLLRIGDSVRFVVISNPSDDSIVIPLTAVTLEASNGDEGVVMTVDDENVAHETKVKIGIKQDGKVQILEGLEGGETIVVEGNYGLPDGAKVEIAKDEEGDEKKDDKEK